MPRHAADHEDATAAEGDARGRAPQQTSPRTANLAVGAEAGDDAAPAARGRGVGPAGSSTRRAPSARGTGVSWNAAEPTNVGSLVHYGSGNAGAVPSLPGGAASATTAVPDDVAGTRGEPSKTRKRVAATAASPPRTSLLDGIVVATDSTTGDAEAAWMADGRTPGADPASARERRDRHRRESYSRLHTSTTHAGLSAAGGDAGHERHRSASTSVADAERPCSSQTVQDGLQDDLLQFKWQDAPLQLRQQVRQRERSYSTRYDQHETCGGGAGNMDGVRLAAAQTAVPEKVLVVDKRDACGTAAALTYFYGVDEAHMDDVEAQMSVETQDETPPEGTETLALKGGLYSTSWTYPACLQLLILIIPLVLLIIFFIAFYHFHAKVQTTPLSKTLSEYLDDLFGVLLEEEKIATQTSTLTMQGKVNTPAVQKTFFTRLTDITAQYNKAKKESDASYGLVTFFIARNKDEVEQTFGELNPFWVDGSDQFIAARQMASIEANTTRAVHNYDALIDEVMLYRHAFALRRRSTVVENFYDLRTIVHTEMSGVVEALRRYFQLNSQGASADHTLTAPTTVEEVQFLRRVLSMFHIAERTMGYATAPTLSAGEAYMNANSSFSELVMPQTVTNTIHALLRTVYDTAPYKSSHRIDKDTLTTLIARNKKYFDDQHKLTWAQMNKQVDWQALLLKVMIVAIVALCFLEIVYYAAILINHFLSREYIRSVNSNTRYLRQALARMHETACKIMHLRTTDLATEEELTDRARLRSILPEERELYLGVRMFCRLEPYIPLPLRFPPPETPELALSHGTLLARPTLFTKRGLVAVRLSFASSCSTARRGRDGRGNGGMSMNSASAPPNESMASGTGTITELLRLSNLERSATSVTKRETVFHAYVKEMLRAVCIFVSAHLPYSETGAYIEYAGTTDAVLWLNMCDDVPYACLIAFSICTALREYCEEMKRESPRMVLCCEDGVVGAVTSYAPHAETPAGDEAGPAVTAADGNSPSASPMWTRFATFSDETEMTEPTSCDVTPSASSGPTQTPGKSKSPAVTSPSTAAGMSPAAVAGNKGGVHGGTSPGSATPGKKTGNQYDTLGQNTPGSADSVLDRAHKTSHGGADRFGRVRPATAEALKAHNFCSRISQALHYYLHGSRRNSLAPGARSKTGAGGGGVGGVGGGRGTRGGKSRSSTYDRLNELDEEGNIILQERLDAEFAPPRSAACLTSFVVYGAVVKELDTMMAFSDIYGESITLNSTFARRLTTEKEMYDQYYRSTRDATSNESSQQTAAVTATTTVAAAAAAATALKMDGVFFSGPRPPFTRQVDGELASAQDVMTPAGLVTRLPTATTTSPTTITTTTTPTSAGLAAPSDQGAASPNALKSREPNDQQQQHLLSAEQVQQQLQDPMNVIGDDVELYVYQLRPVCAPLYIYEHARRMNALPEHNVQGARRRRQQHLLAAESGLARNEGVSEERATTSPATANSELNAYPSSAAALAAMSAATSGTSHEHASGGASKGVDRHHGDDAGQTRPRAALTAAEEDANAGLDRRVRVRETVDFAGLGAGKRYTAECDLRVVYVVVHPSLTKAAATPLDALGDSRRSFVLGQRLSVHNTRPRGSYDSQVTPPLIARAPVALGDVAEWLGVFETFSELCVAVTELQPTCMALQDADVTRLKKLCRQVRRAVEAYGDRHSANAFAALALGRMRDLTNTVSQCVSHGPLTTYAQDTSLLSIETLDAIRLHNDVLLPH